MSNLNIQKITTLMCYYIFSLVLSFNAFLLTRDRKPLRISWTKMGIYWLTEGFRELPLHRAEFRDLIASSKLKSLFISQYGFPLIDLIQADLFYW